MLLVILLIINILLIIINIIIIIIIHCTHYLSSHWLPTVNFGNQRNLKVSHLLAKN